MKHLVRAGAILLAVLILVFVGPRVIPAPAFLAEYGFHPEKIEENVEEWSSLPIQYVSSAVCLDCHQDKYSMWQKGDHRTVACENCHGPARAHVETRAPEVLDTSRALCGLCHAQLVSRPSDFPQVDMEEMGGQAECVTCHDPHEPRAGMPPQVPHALEERTDCQLCHGPHEPWVVMPPEPPHTLEGRTDCLVCHNAGGIKPFPEDHIGRTSATCLNCHRSE